MESLGRRFLVALAAAALTACDTDRGVAAAPLVDAARDATPDARPRDARVLPDFAPPIPPEDASVANPQASDGGSGLDEPLASPGPWGPAARVDFLEIPENADAARRAGCAVEGASAGSSLRNLLALAGGGLDRAVQPDADGRVELVILLRVPDWPEGVASIALERVELQLLEGTQADDDRFLIRRRTFTDGDPEAAPRTRFPDEPVSEGWVETSPRPLLLSVGLSLAPDLVLPLTNGRIRGRLAADGAGFRVDHGLVTGYVTRDDGFTLVEQIREMCAQEVPPGICALVGGQLDRPAEELVSLVVGLLGGFELTWADGRLTPCDPDASGEACNAVGVCALLAARGERIEGVTPD